MVFDFCKIGKINLATLFCYKNFGKRLTKFFCYAKIFSINKNIFESICQIQKR